VVLGGKKIAEVKAQSFSISPTLNVLKKTNLLKKASKSTPKHSLTGTKDNKGFYNYSCGQEFWVAIFGQKLLIFA
jgi:hypothetical protein